MDWLQISTAIREDMHKTSWHGLPTFQDKLSLKVARDMENLPVTRVSRFRFHYHLQLISPDVALDCKNGDDTGKFK